DTVLRSPLGVPAPGGPPAAFVQRAMDVEISAAVPPIVTRVAGICHMTDRHGDGAPETLKEQPAIVTWSVTTSAGLPPSSTFVFDGTDTPCPPWGHMTCVGESRRKAITSPRARRL